MFRVLFLAFLLVPVIEIYFLIEVGSEIGAAWTVFAVIATAVLGTVLIRQQGFATLQRAQSHINQGQLPAVEMLEGVLLLISGAFLLVPGFVTDAIGFLLLIPPLRQTMIKKMLANGQFVFKGSMNRQAYRRQSESDIIEGEVIDDDQQQLK
jgi:UPF0716 protein FxsA